jgi:hypothetical protein
VVAWHYPGILLAITMIKVTRLYYDLPDELHRKVKAAAQAEDRTIKAYLIRALTAAVERTEQDLGLDLTVEDE